MTGPKNKKPSGKEGLVILWVYIQTTSLPQESFLVRFVCFCPCITHKAIGNTQMRKISCEFFYAIVTF